MTIIKLLPERRHQMDSDANTTQGLCPKDTEECTALLGARREGHLIAR